MGKRKYIITAAILAMFGIGFGVTQADSGNNLLQMNVKKSSVPDTVDVTFFTTADNGNSVVTRKSNNKYVVLLPNVASNASVAPSIGGIKDLVSNVEVKHVNDGIGGYTKVTFETTKPINIKTYMRKTSPLTQAQKDYKAILAQNNVEKPKTTTPPKQTEQKATTTQAKPQVTQKPTQTSQPKAATPTKQVAQAKPTTSTSSKTDTKPAAKTQTKPALTIVDVPKSKTVQPVKAKAEKTVKPEIAKVQDTNSVKPKTQQDTYSPKMKYDEHGKRMIDLEPRVSHSLDNQGEKVQEQLPVENSDNSKVQTTTVNDVKNDTTAVEAPTDKNSSKSNFPYWILIAGGSVLTLGILYLILDAKNNANKKDKARLDSFFNLSSKNQTKRRNKEYYDIVNNTDLNWQEKYKSYKEKEEEHKPKKDASEMSYVTDLSGLRKAIIPAEQKLPEKKETPAGKTFDEIRKEKLQAKISKMEHALSQTQEYHEVSNEVKSEDNAITKQMSDVKLKSFSKMISLKETNRTLLGEDKVESRNKSYKEGRFIKLKNSPLSVTSRQSANRLGASDLISTGNKYLTNDGEMKMNKENENYLLSSLDEYLSILDTEEKASSVSATKSSESIKSSTNPVMSRSGVTNPIAKSTQTPYINGLIVKSGYNIDSEKGFYLVNIDGVSALVGRIKDNVFILKKFDYVVDKPLQVRQDDKNIYIVKAGKFKCLVDVSKEKMGTLIEI